MPVPADEVTPRLSIVIPSYNVARYIKVAVESALDQTLQDLEVIVVDDGSTDATAAILQQLHQARQDRRLRIITQPNGGLSAARNSGIRAARGAFIGFLDGDDAWLPTKAACHMAAFDAAPDLGISFSHSFYMRESGEPTGTELLCGNPRPTLHSMIRRNHIGNGSAAIVRSACFDRVGLFRDDLRSCEDYEMWCRILGKTEYRAELVAQSLTMYRLRETSLSFNVRGFLENADRAMVYIKREMPAVPAHVLRAGHAEHYRIAAWKAVSTGQRRVGLGHLHTALRLRPRLLLTDPRAAATALGAVLPGRMRGALELRAKRLQRRRHGHAAGERAEAA